MFHAPKVVKDEVDPMDLEDFEIGLSDLGEVAKDMNGVQPPYKLTFVKSKSEEKGSKAAKGKAKAKESEEEETVHVSSYIAPNPGPYPQDQPKKNTVPFTSVQVR